MTLAGQVVGQASSFLPDYSKGKLAAAYIFRMMNVEPNIDNFSTTGLHKVGAVSYTHLTLPTSCCV